MSVFFTADLTVISMFMNILYTCFILYSNWCAVFELCWL